MYLQPCCPYGLSCEQREEQVGVSREQDQCLPCSGLCPLASPLMVLFPVLRWAGSQAVIPVKHQLWPTK